uniref:Uncharacterized protein n=1 Tax=Chrysotila carterae TaxID=13221 RepID=A0A7S4BHS5_CHRCT
MISFIWDEFILADLTERCITRTADSQRSMHWQKTEHGHGVHHEAGAVGTLAFNNFGVAESISFATAIAQQLTGRTDPATAALISNAFAFAQQFAATQGVDFEFKPSPQELDRMIAANYAATSTSIWKFEQDDLDSSQRLIDALPPSTPRLFAEFAGTHTAPVLLDLSPADIVRAAPLPRKRLG